MAKFNMPSLDLDGLEVTGAPAPTNDSGVANKNYVDEKLDFALGDNMPPDFGSDFYTLPNGVKDYYDQETGEVVRHVGTFIIEDSDVTRATPTNPDLAATSKTSTILATKATDWRWYNQSTSVRPAGSSMIEGWEGKTDGSAIYGRNSLFSILVPKDQYASVDELRAEMRGKIAYYELTTPTREYVGHFSGVSTLLTEVQREVRDLKASFEEAELNTAPEYVIQEANRVADEVLSKRTFDSFVFGAATDFHSNGADISAPGVKHAGQAMKLINNKTQFDLVALMGDYPFLHYDDDQEDKEALTFVRKCFEDIQAPKIMLQGNHDLLRNDYGNHAKSKQFYYSYIGANNTEGVFDHPNLFRNYGYIDYKKHKIRAIYVNTADLADVPVGYAGYSSRISKEQYQWLVGTALTGLETGWGVIVLSHHPINDDGLENFHRILGGFKGKKNGAITIDGTSIPYDFTGVQSEFMAHFHGHNHNFRVKSEVDPTHSVGVLSITIPNACFGRNNEYGTAYGDSHKIKYGDADENGNQRVFNKTAGTKNDTAFNIVVIDRGAKKIHCLNYGAGIDREVSY